MVAASTFAKSLGGLTGKFVRVHLATITASGPMWAYATTVPKITGGSLTEHRATTRRRVFAAVVDLLNDRSFDAITMADIAARAEVGRSALYNHFKDKEDVVVAFASEETDRYLAQLKELLAGVDSPTRQLEVYVRHHVDTSADFHIGLGPELRAILSPASAKAMREHVIAVEQVLRQILTDGAASGEFEIDDVRAIVSLLHATLSARHASADTTTKFVLAAVSADS